MTESKTDTDKEALKAWFKPLLDTVVLDMQARNVVAGTAVEASPVWIFPYKILIAKVWGLGQKNRFIWTIAGEAVITDHIPGNMAATPKAPACQAGEGRKSVIREPGAEVELDAPKATSLKVQKKPAHGLQLHLDLGSRGALRGVAPGPLKGDRLANAQV